jgi:nicotinamide mononucleotide adenylyltransferase
MQDLTEMAKEKVAMIEKALAEGRRVWLGRIQVKKIKMVNSLTGRSAVIVVNDSKVLYLSNFIRYDVRIE